MLTSIKRRLTRKITRQRLETFITTQRTDALTLDVGANVRYYRAYFPNSIAGDIVFYPGLDLLFDGHDLPFASEAFSCVLCTEVLEHCPNPHRVIEEFYRVLQPGGKLILTTRFIFPIHDAPGDFFRFTRYGLAHLCRAFTQVEITAETGTVETVAVLLQRLAAQGDWRLPGFKLWLQLTARLMLRTRWLLKREYANVGKRGEERDILASGYYLTAVKPH